LILARERSVRVSLAEVRVPQIMNRLAREGIVGSRRLRRILLRRSASLGFGSSPHFIRRFLGRLRLLLAALHSIPPFVAGV
jgi:hypothetical protein